MPTTHKANRRARVVQVITVRIDATQLSDDEVAELKDFLDSDDHIASTAIDLPKVTIDPPDRSGSLKRTTAFLTIEASAEPVIVVVNFLLSHAAALSSLSKEVGTDLGKALIVAATTYIVQKLKRLRKTTPTFENVTILGPDGNTVRIVKREVRKK